MVVRLFGTYGEGLDIVPLAFRVLVYITYALLAFECIFFVSYIRPYWHNNKSTKKSRRLVVYMATLPVAFGLMLLSTNVTMEYLHISDTDVSPVKEIPKWPDIFSSLGYWYLLGWSTSLYIDYAKFGEERSLYTTFKKVLWVLILILGFIMSCIDCIKDPPKYASGTKFGLGWFVILASIYFYITLAVYYVDALGRTILNNSIPLLLLSLVYMIFAPIKETYALWVEWSTILALAITVFAIIFADVRDLLNEDLILAREKAKNNDNSDDFDEKYKKFLEKQQLSENERLLFDKTN